MDRFLNAWEFAKRLAGVALVVCLCLYFICCITHGEIVPLPRFELFLNKLMNVIFSSKL